VSAVERTRPDFLIVALEKFNRLPQVCHSVLQSYPQMKVIAVSSESQQLHVLLGLAEGAVQRD